MNSFYVYVYRDAIGTPFYVGKGHGNRCKFHLYACHKPKRLSYRTMFYKKLRKMARLDEKPIIEILKNNLTEKDAFQWERYYIAFWGRRDIKTGCLCNHTDGGEGLIGHRHSEETRRKMSKSHQGVKLSASHRVSMSKAQRGRVTLPETKKKMSLAKRGKKFSKQHCSNLSKAKTNPPEEVRAKMSKAHKKPVIAMDIKTGEDLMKFDGLIDAGEFFDIARSGIWSALCGRSRTSVGCRWRYA